MAEDSYTRITMTVNNELYNQLDRIAGARSKAVEGIAVKALREFVDQHPPPREARPEGGAS